MNPESPTPREQIEARLTALLLGELSADEAAALRELMANDAQLNALHVRLKRTIELVRETANDPAEATAEPPTPLRLGAERREKLLAQFKTVAPREFKRPEPRRNPLTVVLELAAVIAIIGCLAGLLLPSLANSKAKARSVSQRSEVMENLRQIDGAKQQWAVEHKASPEAVPTMQDLLPYLDRGGGETPKPVMGETYVIGKLDESPAAELDVNNARKMLGGEATQSLSEGTARPRVVLSEEGRLALLDKNGAPVRQSPGQQFSGAAQPPAPEATPKTPETPAIKPGNIVLPSTAETAGEQLGQSAQDASVALPAMQLAFNEQPPQNQPAEQRAVEGFGPAQAQAVGGGSTVTLTNGVIRPTTTVNGGGMMQFENGSAAPIQLAGGQIATFQNALPAAPPMPAAGGSTVQSQDVLTAPTVTTESGSSATAYDNSGQAVPVNRGASGGRGGGGGGGGGGAGGGGFGGGGGGGRMTARSRGTAGQTDSFGNLVDAEQTNASAPTLQHRYALEGGSVAGPASRRGSGPQSGDTPRAKTIASGNTTATLGFNWNSGNVAVNGTNSFAGSPGAAATASYDSPSGKIPIFYANPTPIPNLADELFTKSGMTPQQAILDGTPPQSAADINAPGAVIAGATTTTPMPAQTAVLGDYNAINKSFSGGKAINNGSAPSTASGEVALQNGNPPDGPSLAERLFSKSQEAVNFTNSGSTELALNGDFWRDAATTSNGVTYVNLGFQFNDTPGGYAANNGPVSSANAIMQVDKSWAARLQPTQPDATIHSIPLKYSDPQNIQQALKSVLASRGLDTNSISYDAETHSIIYTSIDGKTADSVSNLVASLDTQTSQSLIGGNTLQNRAQSVQQNMLRNTLNAPETTPASAPAGRSGSGIQFVTGSGSADNAINARALLSSAGINLSSNDIVIYNDRKGTLTVRTSAQDSDLIKAAIQSGKLPATMATPPRVNRGQTIMQLQVTNLTALSSPVIVAQNQLNYRMSATNGVVAEDRPLAKPATPPLEPQPEVLAQENAFSTFSLNVSDVSFKLAAASLDEGVMPDAGSVRSEEFINAFDYRDPEPAPGAPIGFAWERAHYPFAHNRDLLRFSVKTAAAGRQPGRPLNLVLLLDNSGSMERADRVAIIKEALKVLAAQLQSQDKISVVTFARTARLWVDGIPGTQAPQVLDTVGGLTPEGGTDLGDALDLAYATAHRHYLMNGVNRVVLLTDGAANLGNTDPEALKKNVEAQRKQGIDLDCFGIGWEGYNDDLLETLTRNGDGRYGFINTPEEAADGFAGQLAGALRVAASDVKVQVEFNPARVVSYRQLGYAKHQLTKEQFRDNTVTAAQIGAAEAGNALYTVELNPQGTGPVCTVRVRYRDPGTADYHEHAWDVPYTGNAVALEQAGAAMKLAATASAFSEWLAASPFAGEVTPDALLGYLRGVPEVYGADTRPAQLETMIREAKSVTGK